MEKNMECRRCRRCYPSTCLSPDELCDKCVRFLQDCDKTKGFVDSLQTVAPPVQEGEYKVKDSGEREKFETGAQRDTQVGKGRFDLIPPLLLYRMARLYEAGALKYGDRNWTGKRGCPSLGISTPPSAIWSS
jgi:hypothetical protein